MMKIANEIMPNIKNAAEKTAEYINGFLTLSSLKPSSAKTLGIKIKTATDSKTDSNRKRTAPIAKYLPQPVLGMFFKNAANRTIEPELSVVRCLKASNKSLIESLFSSERNFSIISPCHITARITGKST